MNGIRQFMCENPNHNDTKQFWYYVPTNELIFKTNKETQLILLDFYVGRENCGPF